MGASDVYRLVGKWLAETRSSYSRTILEKYLKHAVTLAEDHMTTDKKSMGRQSQTHCHLARYADALLHSYLEALRGLKSSSKGDKTDYSIKIQELQKQLPMDREEAEQLQQDKDNFLSIALEGYKHCLVIGDKYDIRVVPSYKFIPLGYQITSRLGGPKDGQGAQSFQSALVSFLKKMDIDNQYHTVFQHLALANGDRIKDKQRSRNSFVVDMDKKYVVENLLNELSSYHGAVIRQMKQMVELYIKLAELETKEDTNKKVTLPRDIRSIRQLERVPVDSVTYVSNEFSCNKYRQLAKSGNDDPRQDAVMEQLFGLVNTILQNHREYLETETKNTVGVLEWVSGTVPLGEYLIGSGGAMGAMELVTGISQMPAAHGYGK
ncbi:hypothetical protein POM88_035782 [Heracleum sosnowskyi]|uniref:Uncharacterized protein n=1 Tax=Heracleum sosnowskyi TaxID=360622 RepID=A0AAD8MBU1_9APIA|nr:hypothetical protein POM88_035782 [Heracleum sosnowskyi]